MAKKAQSSKRPKHKKNMANRKRTSKFAQIFRSPRLKPLLFVLPFVVVAAVIMLFRSKAAVPAAVPHAGIWMIWGDVATVKKPFVKGGQAVVEWTDLRRIGDNNYHWDAKSFGGWTGFGDINNFGGKPFTIQVNSNFKLPCNYSAAGCTPAKNPNSPAAGGNKSKKWFGYGSNIAWCGKFGPEANPTSFDVPQFWNTTRTGLNPTYKAHLDDMVSNLSARLTAPGFPKNRLLGVRTAPNLIGTEHSNFADDKVRDVPDAAICNQKALSPGQWKSLGNNAEAESIGLYKTYFYDNKTGIKPIFRAEHLQASIPADKQLFFYTNASPDTKNQYASSDIFYVKARNGSHQAYYEPFQKSEFYTSPVTWNYWLILEQLHRGVNYIAIYADDLRKAGNDACPQNTSSILGNTGNEAIEYRMAYCFANKYAPYANNQNNPAKAKASPGAWIAFTRNELSPNNSGYIGMYLDGNNIASNSNQANIAFVETNLAVKTNIAAQGGGMGNPAQRYGRFARSITPSESLNMNMNSHFKSNLTGSIRVNVTFLDTGQGSVSLKWGNTSDKTALFDKGSTPNNWVTKTVTIAVGDLPESGNDFTLTTTGSNTTFHMVEVLR